MSSQHEIHHAGDPVVPGSLISRGDVDGGRAYGVDESGQICVIWNNAGVLGYGIVQ